MRIASFVVLSIVVAATRQPAAEQAAAARAQPAQDATVDLLQKLADVPGPPGFEEPVRALLVELMKPLASSLTFDGLGSIIATQGTSGPRIMVDANHAYDATAAIRLGRDIEPLDIAWFEEPVPPEDLAGYREVKAALTIPVAGGEAEFTRWGFRPLIAERLVDILQPDVCAAGGISESKKIADMANAFGVRVNPHVWGTGVGLAASLQPIGSSSLRSISASTASGSLKPSPEKNLMPLSA